MQKHLCVLVQFLSDQRKEIVTGFIGLIPVQEATGEKIFSFIGEEIKRCGQSLAPPPLPFKNPSFTRWLVCGKVIFNILMNWEELMAYFTSTELAQSQFDTKFKLRLLKEMSDYKNYLFFEFAASVV
jgi:hypothetical protein